jgi:hypothetical protein
MASPATSERAAEPAAEPEPFGLEILAEIVHGVEGRPGLAEVLVRLQQAHRKDLVRVERWTSGDLARHPEPRELIRSRRKPGNLDELGRLKRVYDSRRVMTSDIHENRVVLHAVREVRRALEACEEADAAALLLELDAAIARRRSSKTSGVCADCPEYRPRPSRETPSTEPSTKPGSPCAARRPRPCEPRCSLIDMLS